LFVCDSVIPAALWLSSQFALSSRDGLVRTLNT